ncbi:HAMP domain-containing sensor histidine kinase [Clostridium sp. LIBA-8841]|uniref:sensor histidine kinase n=1 Tax=Clostridium sp. LIBA-8841 TaxID=2987530 RepID=UPI002AC7AD9C|nr:HAMP domain-containing sensor histidine kinase [Clostridium sp. LIBA-8841]MDZ5253654.1 HAMP domain-containing histidine kinase [Clostridium sp. LIBA-8841]
MKSNITIQYSIMTILIVLIVTIINVVGIFLILMQSNLDYALLEVLIGMPILEFIVAISFGVRFSKKVTEPMKEVIKGVENLEDGKYEILYEEDGLYKDVKVKLNNLANKLKQNEVERKKIEVMRNEWISNITHDIKTPLSSIKGYAELLESYSDFTEDEIKQYGFVINQKSEYIKQLVDDLNLTVYLKDDKRILNMQKANLVTEIKKSIISILNDSIYSEREITFESNKDVIDETFDIKLLKRLINNIIYNALIHNDEDVKIDVEVLKAEKTHIIIKDNGKGISEEDLENIFNKYYRGTNTSYLHKGSGLGMAIVYNVVKAHGWDITIESKLGKGTRIEIII